MATGTVVDNDSDDDGVCNATKVRLSPKPRPATTTATSTTDTDDTLCVFKVDACDTCSGETDGTGTVVDNDATTTASAMTTRVTGCTDPTACNYDATSTTDTDNTPVLHTSMACVTPARRDRWNGIVVDNDDDNDGVCDDDEVTGCTNASACNYDATSTTDTDKRSVSCHRGATPALERPMAQELLWTTTSDDDGVCDADEITGCTDPTACNYDATSTTDTDNTSASSRSMPATPALETDGTGTS